MKSKKLLWSMSLFLMASICGCQGKDSNSLQGKNTETTTEATEVMELVEETEPEILHFVDAHGQWYDAEIKDNVKKHNYNWESLSCDGQELIYDDDNYYIRKGIDVSKYQGNIDWQSVKDDGFEFVIIRIGYRGYGESGQLKEDETFHSYIEGAQAVGLDVGVYFFSQAINEAEAVEEADFITKLLEGYQINMPVVFDPELIQNDEARTDNVTGEQFTRNTIAFCRRIEEAGLEPMLYSNMYWEAFIFNMEELEEIPVWYADYEAKPQTPYAFEYWQYSEHGVVNGVENECDLDVQFIKK